MDAAIAIICADEEQRELRARLLDPELTQAQADEIWEEIAGLDRLVEILSDGQDEVTNGTIDHCADF